MDPATLTYAPHIWFNNFWLLRDYLVGAGQGGVEGVEWQGWLRRAACRSASVSGATSAPARPAPPCVPQVPVNESLAELELHLELSSVASWKYMLMSQVGRQSVCACVAWDCVAGALAPAFLVLCSCCARVVLVLRPLPHPPTHPPPHPAPQMDNSFSMQRDWGAMSDGESDEVKRIFLEGNPLLLALTVCVSMLHSGAAARGGVCVRVWVCARVHACVQASTLSTLFAFSPVCCPPPPPPPPHTPHHTTHTHPAPAAVFDMLAFKNDIGFWKNNKSMRGLSGAGAARSNWQPPASARRKGPHRLLRCPSGDARQLSLALPAMPPLRI